MGGGEKKPGGGGGGGGLKGDVTKSSIFKCDRCVRQGVVVSVHQS
jgi:hypothetical protein